jgi:2-oxoglutarate ferredoxin oxidoreductase subunit alpha
MASDTQVGAPTVSAITAVNDFVVKFANVNGSGSASANGLFAKSILRMGVPASSRNIFPSNIQGLPTWFEVRISESGHLARRGGVDMMVAMNPQTWKEDIAEIEPGGYLFYDSTRPMPASRFRDDINVIGAPLTEICNRTYDDMRQRQLFKNIIYLGVLSALLDMDVPAIEELIGAQFRGRDALIRPNLHALQLGRDWAAQALDCPLGIRLEKRDKVSLSPATMRRPWARSTAAQPFAPGIRSRPHRRSPRPSARIAIACAAIQRPSRTNSPSSRPKTSWPRSAW